MTSNLATHILIGGSKGVGKTTLLKLLAKEKFNVIIFSDLLKSSAQEMLGKNFLRLNQRDRDLLRIRVVDDILDKKEAGLYVWEVHFCCYEFGKKRIVVPNNLLAVSSSLILFKLQDDMLKERRLNDSTKKRSILQKIIKRDSRIEEEAAKKLSKKYRIPLTYYTNDLDFENSVNNSSTMLKATVS